MRKAINYSYYPDLQLPDVAPLKKLSKRKKAAGSDDNDDHDYREEVAPPPASKKRKTASNPVPSKLAKTPAPVVGKPSSTTFIPSIPQACAPKASTSKAPYVEEDDKDDEEDADYVEEQEGAEELDEEALEAEAEEEQQEIAEIIAVEDDAQHGDLLETRRFSIPADSPILEELHKKAKAAGLPIEAILDGVRHDRVTEGEARETIAVSQDVLWKVAQEVIVMFAK